MTLTVEDYRKLARAYEAAQSDEAIYEGSFEEVAMPGEMISHQFVGPIKAKERPRAGKGGRMYTPTETRKFEKAVRDWGKETFSAPIAHPIRVWLVIHEGNDQPDLVLHSLFGLTYNEKGDIDNFAKAILDGLNGVAFVDDKQIVDIRIRRRYSTQSGFRINMIRKGLSKFEYQQFLKFLKV